MTSYFYLFIYFDRYSDDYVDCVGNVIKSFCSMAAESWQTKFVRKSFCPLLVSQNCLGWATQCSTCYIISYSLQELLYLLTIVVSSARGGL